MIAAPFIGRLMGSVFARKAAQAGPAPAVAATAVQAPTLSSVGGVLAGGIQPRGMQPLGIQPDAGMTAMQRTMKMMKGLI